MPRVSVLIPAFNAEKMVQRAVDSALSQTLKDLEVIVVDDASSDGTAALIAELSRRDPRVRLYRREKNGGPAATRNTAMSVASGDWFALLDADDVMKPDRLERLLGAATDEDVLVADNLEMYDMHAGKVVKLGIDVALIGERLRLDCKGFVARCRTNQPDAIDFGLLKPLLRAAHLRQHGLAYDETIRHGEDFRLYLDALLAGGRLLVLPEAMYRYTERTGSISGKASGVSATQARYDMVESQTRALIADPRYAEVAQELSLRANALRRLVKIAAFRRHSRWVKLALLPVMIVDGDMRGYFGSQLRIRANQLLRTG